MLHPRRKPQPSLRDMCIEELTKTPSLSIAQVAARGVFHIPVEEDMVNVFVK